MAVECAKLLNGEIISADSRQVYTGLDIGTGKITTDEMQGIPHHLLSVANPNDDFAVTDYKILAEAAITDVVSRNKLPILCGGTGQYINTVIDNLIVPDVPANAELREKLSEFSTHELYKKLLAVDPERAETIDSKNPRRLIRALEIAEALGTVPPKTYGEKKYEPIMIGVQISTEELRMRIHTRLLVRIEMGMIDEAKKLHETGVSYERMESLGLEYRFLARHLEGSLTKEEMIAGLLQAIIDYSKRQMTWFRKDTRIKWLTLPEILPYVQALFESR